jgi:hypothetical protein
LKNGDCGNFPALLPQLREQFAENATSCQKELRGCMRSSLMAIYGNVGISVMHNIPFPKGGTPRGLSMVDFGAAFSIPDKRSRGTEVLEGAYLRLRNPQNPRN